MNGDLALFGAPDCRYCLFRENSKEYDSVGTIKEKGNC